MGLAAPKNRQKLSRDPNNTAWARDSTGFGHKILVSQGWTPGGYLGAEDAKHSSHFTAASASHIKVTLKDDTLGIGAKRSGETAETFGLGALADIYGRLSGKETPQQQAERQKVRADVGRKIYSERRYGPTIFVSGGFLVGDRVQGDLEANKRAQGTEQIVLENEQDLIALKSKSKSKSKEKSKKRKAGESSSHDRARDDPGEPKPKKVKKRDLTNQDVTGETAQPSDLTKAEKQKRKEERRERRERKAAKRVAKAAAASNASPDATETSDAAEDTGNVETAQATSKAPAAFQGSRQALRRRFIQSKRMAMNPQALREILMAKS